MIRKYSSSKISIYTHNIILHHSEPFGLLFDVHSSQIFFWWDCVLFTSLICDTFGDASIQRLSFVQYTWFQYWQCLFHDWYFLNDSVDVLDFYVYTCLKNRCQPPVDYPPRLWRVVRVVSDLRPLVFRGKMLVSGRVKPKRLVIFVGSSQHKSTCLSIHVHHILPEYTTFCPKYWCWNQAWTAKPGPSLGCGNGLGVFWGESWKASRPKKPREILHWVVVSNMFVGEMI